MGSRTRKTVIVTGLLFLVGTIVSIVIFSISNREDGSELNTESGQLQPTEFVEPVTSFNTRTVGEIIGQSDSEDNIVLELTQAASLNISVGDYEKAIQYQEAMLNLDVLGQTEKDILLYETLLTSRQLGDDDRVQKYSNELGPEKLEQFDMPQESLDELE